MLDRLSGFTHGSHTREACSRLLPVFPTGGVFRLRLFSMRLLVRIASLAFACDARSACFHRKCFNKKPFRHTRPGRVIVVGLSSQAQTNLPGRTVFLRLFSSGTTLSSSCRSGYHCWRVMSNDRFCATAHAPMPRSPAQASKKAYPRWR